MRRLRLAIAGLTACSGCQLSLLNCEDELPELFEKFEFHFFPMACSPALLTGQYDAALVEGCLSMPHENELLQELRRRSVYLIALGTCAICGGVAALRNGEERELLRQQVYGQHLVAGETFDPMPLQNVVQVDAAVSGCPPEKQELLRMLAGLVRGVLPVNIDYPVCTECRMKENLCLLMERNALCLGPVILGGCGARCPSLAVPCEGCRGALAEANLAEALEIYAQKGFDRQIVLERLRRFSPEWQQ
ncbi:MAG: NADH:ubiquinone oxidoreductase [Desulfuromonadaceae bacterium]|nr:NADH:ubiquinone oxidoreductase [Desulfuromonadaceae bacterium]